MQNQVSTSPLEVTPLDVWCSECKAPAGRGCQVWNQGLHEYQGLRHAPHSIRLYGAECFKDGWDAAITAVAAMKVNRDD